MSESTEPRYPLETLGGDDDDGTMPENVSALREAVVGRRIVSAETRTIKGRWYTQKAFVLTLDNAQEVQLINSDDCCAYTELEEFWQNPELIEHVITGVGTTDGYETWHIYADLGDVMRLKVGWSPGNPFYYGYGFDIRVEPVTIIVDAAAPGDEAGNAATPGLTA